VAAPLLSPSARQRQQQGQLRQALEQKDGVGLRHLSERLVHRQGPAALRAMVAKLAQSPEEVAFWWAQMQAPQAPVGSQALQAGLVDVSGEASGEGLWKVPVGLSEAKEIKGIKEASEINEVSEVKDINRVIPEEFKLDVQVDVGLGSHGQAESRIPSESEDPLGLEAEVKAEVQVELREDIRAEVQEDIQEDIHQEVQLEFSKEPQAKVLIDSQFVSQATDQPPLPAEQVVASNQVVDSNQGDSVETPAPAPTPAPGSSSAIARGQKLRGWLPSWDGPIRKAS